MESALERLPPEYFDTTKGQLLKRSSHRSRKKRQLRRRKTQKVTSQEEQKEQCRLVLVVVANVLLFSLLLVFILWRRSIVVDTVVCPKGYFGEMCERNDFIDTLQWSSDDEFKAADGVCTSGYSFRTWAPGATTVNLWIRPEESAESSHYGMKWWYVTGIMHRQQNYGYWFISLCNVHVGDRYKYQFIYITNNGYILSLGGLERTPSFLPLRLTRRLQQEGYNVVSDTAFDWKNQSSSVIPFPDLPIVYHIHLPTYNHSLCTVSRRAQS